MASLLCILVGHQPPVYAAKGWYSPGEQYGKVRLGAVDGIDRQHAEVICKCARCDEQFTVARIHVPRLEKTNDPTPLSKTR
jgi:hypothetical protein